jgi:DNA-binding beta-propeller fold protein YncE
MRDDLMTPTRLFAGRRAVALSVILTLVGCASAGSPPSPSATPAATSMATPAAAATTATASPTPAGPTPIAVPSMALEPALATVWESAGPAKGRKWTWSPEVDPQGRIWAASSFDDVFWIFDHDGKYLESWGTPGNDFGQLSLSAEGNGYGDIAFDASGGFYIVEAGVSRVEQFDKNRAFVKSWGSFGTGDGQFTLAIDIAIGPAGHVYVYDGGRHDVQEFDADGTFIRATAPGVGPYFDVDPDGNVFAVENQEKMTILQKYAPDGSRLFAVDLRPVLSFATGIDITPSGRIFVASSTNGDSAFEYENLIELDSTGELLHLWPNGGEGIAVDPKGGRLYETFSDKTPVVRALTLPTK